MSSEHLAQELGNGLSGDGPDCPSRGPRLSQRSAAGRRSSWRPGWAGVKPRAHADAERAVGLTGSGPTLWTLYPSIRGGRSGRGGSRAVAAGRSRRSAPTATIIATTIASPATGTRNDQGVPRKWPGDHPAPDPIVNEVPHDPPGRFSTNGAPAAIGPYSQAIMSGDFVFCSGQGRPGPLTGELRREGRWRRRAAARCATSAPCSTWPASAGGARQDHASPGGHRRLRGHERRLRDVLPEPPPARSTFAVARPPEGRPDRDRGHRAQALGGRA